MWTALANHTSMMAHKLSRDEGRRENRGPGPWHSHGQMFRRATGIPRPATPLSRVGQRFEGEGGGSWYSRGPGGGIVPVAPGGGGRHIRIRVIVGGQLCPWGIPRLRPPGLAATPSSLLS